MLLTQYWVGLWTQPHSTFCLYTVYSQVTHKQMLTGYKHAKSEAMLVKNMLKLSSVYVTLT